MSEVEALEKKAVSAIVNANQKLDVEKIPQSGRDLSLLVRQTALNLEETLDSEKVYVNQKVLANMQMMYEDLKKFNKKISDQEEHWKDTYDSYEKSTGKDKLKYMADAKAKKNIYSSFSSSNKKEIERRKNEYDEMYKKWTSFKFNGKIPKEERKIPLNADDAHEINIQEYLMSSETDDPSTYILCDSTWKELEEDDGVFVYEHWWEKIRIKWIVLPKPWASWTKKTHISFRNVSVSPSDATIPDPLPLSLSAVHKDVGKTWLDLINNRPFVITLWVKLTDDERQEAITKVNKDERFKNYITKTLEDDDVYYGAYDEALKKIYPKQRGAVENDAMRHLFIERFAWCVDDFADIRNNDGMDNLVEEFSRYLTWRTVFDEDPKVDIPSDILRDKNKLPLWIQSNYASLLPWFLSFYIQHRLQQNQKNTLELGNHLQDFDPLENTDTRVALTDTLNTANDFNEKGHHVKGERSNNNYLRYIKESLDANGDDWWPKAVGNTLRVNDKDMSYGLALQMEPSGQVRIQVKLKNTTDDKEIPVHEIKAWTPAKLMQKILRNQEIPGGILRSHIAFASLKLLIEQAQRAGIVLEGRCDRTTIQWVQRPHGEKSEQLTYGQWFKLWVENGAVKLVNKSVSRTWDVTYGELYDEDRFASTNNIAAHRVALTRIAEVFNMSMSQFHQQRQEAIRAWSTLWKRPWRSRNLLWMRWTRWWTKLKNRDTKNEFSFSHDKPLVSTDGTKQAHINYDGTHFHVTLDWETPWGERMHKTFKTNDLRKLMNLKHKWFWWNLMRAMTGHSMWLSKNNRRYFDGLEFALMWASNKAIFDGMRKNTKIARTNFEVEDPRTWRVYVIDTDWNIWYVSYNEADQEPRAKGIVKKLKRWLAKKSREGIKWAKRDGTIIDQWDKQFRMFRAAWRFMGSWYCEVDDRDVTMWRKMLTPEEEKAFWTNIPIQHELQQAFKKRINRWHWM